MALEASARPYPRFRDILAALDRHMAANAVVAWLFSVTGPLAILLAVASRAGLAREDIASWIFGGYALGGVFGILVSFLYRQPIGIAWSIPAAVLIGPALEHLAFPEVIGAYLATGAVILVLGLTGWVGKVMRLVPMPIVMGMVGGVFLPFGLRIVSGFADEFLIAFAMVAAFLAVSALPHIARILPPVLVALVAGVIAVVATGHATLGEPLRFALAEPKIYAPVFTARALLELVVPLTVTVVAIHNAQGFAILAAAGYK
ncbi:MAG: benzoate/H(+) symporter BenE family transporter, partial [Alphaproteobacteria bacterium]